MVCQHFEDRTHPSIDNELHGHCSILFEVILNIVRVVSIVSVYAFLIIKTTLHNRIKTQFYSLLEF